MENCRDGGHAVPLMPQLSCLEKAYATRWGRLGLMDKASDLYSEDCGSSLTGDVVAEVERWQDKRHHTPKGNALANQETSSKKKRQQ